MTGASTESRGWTRGRWFAVIGTIILAQFGGIIWLSRQKPPTNSTPVAPTVAEPAFVFAESSAQLLAINDTTQFILPDRNGFSGEVWMKTPQQQFSLPRWSEEPRQLSLSPDQLGSDATNFIRTNLAPDVQLAGHADPVMPPILPEVSSITNASFVTVEGDISKRQLLTPLKLQAWPAADGAEILNNTIVRIGVDRDGFVFSAVLAATGNAAGQSGSKDADMNALSQARAARFEPLRQSKQSGAESPLQWGRMIFHWQTIPAPATNPVANP